jgi:hypothetical protein
MVDVRFGILILRSCDLKGNCCVLREEKVKNSIFAGILARNVSFEAQEARQEGRSLIAAHAAIF